MPGWHADGAGKRRRVRVARLARRRCRDVRCRLAFCDRAVVAGGAVGDARRVNERRAKERSC